MRVSRSAYQCDDGKTLTCNGPIGYPIATDWGKLAKIGAGTLVLGGSNNFTNWFEVLEGKVVLANANAFVGKNGVKPPVRVEAVLDLGDLSFSIPKLAGADGVISNGVVTVENATTLGDDGKCAPLAFFGDLNLTGSLTMDVAADGASDQLQVTGDLNLNNVDLQLADVGELSKTHEYTLISVTDGALNGRFVSDNLPDNWYLVYLSNEIHLKYTTGLNVILH